MTTATYHSVRSSDEKVVITWKDINFETLEKVADTSTFYRTTYRKKIILDNVSGHAQTKELLAILGPTGCG
jgi:ABC-type sugar transport system ATPase subunit